MTPLSQLFNVNAIESINVKKKETHGSKLIKE